MYMYTIHIYRIESIDKDSKFSGVLTLLERGETVWSEYFFVLCDTTLLYFKSSKHREPSGVIVLKYACLSVDEEALRYTYIVFVFVLAYGIWEMVYVTLHYCIEICMSVCA